MNTNQKKQDPRTKKTKQLLQSNLLQMLKTQPIDKISVSKLCAQSEINRSTFYQYYHNPHDLLDQIEKEVFQEVKKQMDQFGFSIPDTILNVTRNMAVHQDLCKLIFSSSIENSFLNELFLFTRDRTLLTWQNKYPTIPHAQLEYLFIFLAKGSIGMIEQWVETEFKESPDHIAHLLESFYQNTMQVLHPTPYPKL